MHAWLVHKVEQILLDLKHACVRPQRRQGGRTRCTSVPQSRAAPVPPASKPASPAPTPTLPSRRSSLLGLTGRRYPSCDDALLLSRLLLIKGVDKDKATVKAKRSSQLLALDSSARGGGEY